MIQMGNKAFKITIAGIDTSIEIASEIDADADAVMRLCRAATEMGFFALNDDKLSITDQGYLITNINIRIILVCWSS